MVNKKRNYRFVILPVFLFAIFGLAMLPLFDTSQEKISNEDYNPIEYDAYVCTTHTLADGSVAMSECSSNTLTNAGAEAIIDFIKNGGGTAFDYIGLCNATASCNVSAAANTILDSEYTSSGLTRAQGTDSNPAGTGNVSIYYEFTATANDLETNKTGLFNASADDTLLAENTFTLVTLQTDDKLTVNWTIQVS